MKNATVHEPEQVPAFVYVALLTVCHSEQNYFQKLRFAMHINHLVLFFSSAKYFWIEGLKKSFYR